MKLVNEDIPTDGKILSFSHTAWEELFGDREWLEEGELDKFAEQFDCKVKCYLYEDDWDDEEIPNLYEMDNPLDQWPLERDLNKDVLLGYYENEDGYQQVWAVDKGEE